MLLALGYKTVQWLVIREVATLIQILTFFYSKSVKFYSDHFTPGGKKTALRW